eukprot:4719042-Amphidinium_carterae.4
MIAIVSSRRIAIEEGVAANVGVSVSWMNCQKPFPQKRHLMSLYQCVRLRLSTSLNDRLLSSCESSLFIVSFTAVSENIVND